MASCGFCGPCGPRDLTLTITMLGNEIANILPKQKLLIFNAILKQLSDVIGTIIVQRDFCESLADPSNKSALEEEEITEELE